MWAVVRIFGILVYSILSVSAVNAFEVTELSETSGAVAHGPLTGRVQFSAGDIANPRVTAGGHFEGFGFRMGYKDGLDEVFSARAPGAHAASSFLGKASGFALNGQNVSAAVGMRDGNVAGGLELGTERFAARALTHDGRIALEGGARLRLGSHTRLQAGVRTRLASADPRTRLDLKLRSRRILTDRDDLTLQFGAGTARDPSASLAYAVPWMDGNLEVRGEFGEAHELKLNWEITW
ncbi:hypothetical protein SAMN05216241_11137 [Limimonas halophila]|uniref:Uncharacterized protein n=1 Tax=Limimonas halophila TaxID=1082479 RepID=A0A1G7U0T7_9PROT|nr:hypothetical protein [Limimonas halophila]SDG41265.1 hypothetical protein SAMN05216241_11137 [Limimonas halophila]